MHGRTYSSWSGCDLRSLRRRHYWHTRGDRHDGAGPVIPPPLEFAPARLSLATGAVTSSVLAVVLGALVVLAFGWSLWETVIETLIGIVVFSVLEFFTTTRHEIPQAADLPRAPVDALVERRWW